MAPLKKSLRPVAATIGRRIAALRAARGMTQGELAARVHSSGAVISRLENGAELASMSRLIDIAKALGVELRDIFESTSISNDPREADIAEISAILRKSSVEDVHRAVEIVRALVK